MTDGLTRPTGFAGAGSAAELHQEGQNWNNKDNLLLTHTGSQLRRKPACSLGRSRQSPPGPVPRFQRSSGEASQLQRPLSRRQRIHDPIGHKGRSSGESEKLRIPKSTLDVRSNRTQVGRAWTENRWCRGRRFRLPKKWRTRMEQPQDWRSLGMWRKRKIAPPAPQCRSKYWAKEDPDGEPGVPIQVPSQREEPCKFREGRHDGFFF